jgi:hypothetical protein
LKEEFEKLVKNLGEKFEGDLENKKQELIESI